MKTFWNRRDAGRRLADSLRDYANRPDVIVLALPKGGVPVAAEVASTLGCPLDVLVVRKIGVPWNREVAVGAIASGGMLVLDIPMIDHFDLTNADLDPVIRAEREELARRESHFRKGRSYPALEDKVVILVDDGLATGATMQAAVGVVKTQKPAAIVVAVPVASVSALDALELLVDRVVCLETPEPFYGVGASFTDFIQTTDEEVLSLLTRTATNYLLTHGPSYGGALKS